MYTRLVLDECRRPLQLVDGDVPRVVYVDLLKK